MDTADTLQLDLTPQPLQEISAGAEGQALFGRDSSGCGYELRVLLGHAMTPTRQSQISEQLKRIGLLEHESVRRITQCDIQGAPPSFQLVLPRDLNPLVSRLSILNDSLRLRSRLELAASVVDATVSAHRVGVCHGSFDPSTILVRTIGDGSTALIDFTGIACSDSVVIGEFSVEDDLVRLRALLSDLLMDRFEDASPDLLDGRQRALLRRFIRLAEDPPPPLSQWQSVLDRFLPSKNDLELTRGMPPHFDSMDSDVTLPLDGQSTGELDGQSTGQPDSIAPIPKQLGRFKLHEKIGEGGMGSVFRAVDQSNEQIVAVKVLRPTGADLAVSIRRFRKEARLLADAQNEHVTELIEIGDDQGCHYLAMEFINGIDLKQWLDDRGPLPEQEALILAADLAKALVDAHSREVVHRDIKPENVLLQLRDGASNEEISFADRPISDFILKLTDFGIARHVNQSQSMEMTRAGSVLGTPRYMSPEQCKSSETIGPATDVYSMGITLFELLTGKVPFDADDFMKIAGMHCFGNIPSVQKQVPSISDPVDRIVQRAMAKDPGDRFGDAGQMLAELMNVIRGEACDVEAHPRLPEHDPTKVWDKTVTWQLTSMPSELWPYVSNTERLNESIGLPAVHYRTEKDPDLGLRKFGSFTLSGVKVSWEEHPFEWIEGQRMGILREFDAGPFKWFLSRVTLQPTADGGTQLSHQVTIEPRSVVGRVLTKIEADWKGFRNLSRVYERMDRSIQGQLRSSEGRDAFRAVKPLGRQEADRLGHRIDLLIESGIDPEVAAAIESTLTHWSSQELSQIRPLALASQFGFDGSAATDACLTAATLGLLRLRWDVLCPTCRVTATTSTQLSSIEAHSHCEACDVDFRSNLGDAIEMVFEAHPEIRELNQGQYCIGGPEHSPHVVAQVRIEAGERIEIKLDLGVGDYLLRGPQLPKTQPIRIEDKAAPSAIDFALSTLGEGHHTPKLRSGRQTVTFTNDQTHLRVVRIERTIPRDDVITATMASANATFRRLFPDQKFSQNNPVQTETMTFVATCISNMEELYSQMGDAHAYSHLHEHHERIAVLVTSAGGAVIKTMSERVLACFQHCEDAVEASFRIRESVDTSNRERPEGSLELGIAIHSGVTLVTTQNQQMDYFGATVRAVSALPDHAGADTLITEPVYSDPVVIRLLGNPPEMVETMSVPGGPKLRVKRIVVQGK